MSCSDFFDFALDFHMDSNTNGVDVKFSVIMETDAETPVTGIMSLSWNGHSNGVNGIAERDHANTNDNHRRRSSTNST